MYPSVWPGEAEPVLRIGLGGREGVLQRGIDRLEAGSWSLDLVLDDDVPRQIIDDRRERTTLLVKELEDESNPDRRVPTKVYLGENHPAVPFAADRRTYVAHRRRHLHLADRRALDRNASRLGDVL